MIHLSSEPRHFRFNQNFTINLKFVLCISIIFFGFGCAKTSEIILTNETDSGSPTVIVFASITPCASLSLNEGAVFNCNQTTAADDVWYFGPNHTCDWMSVEQDLGLISGIPTFSDVGTCTLDLFALSTDPTPVNSQFTITVNNLQPTLVLAPSVLNEDAPLTVVLTNLQVQANEESNAIGNYFLNDSFTLGSPLCSSVGSLKINTVNGELSFKPNLNFNGVCSFSVAYADGLGLPNSTVFTETQITVNSVNDAPIVLISAPLNLTQDVAMNVTASASDPDTGNIYTYSLGSSNTCAWATINITSGLITGTPNDNQVGSCILGLRVFDGTVFSLERTETLTIFNLRPSLLISDVAIASGGGLIILRTNAEVQSNEEGFGVYSFDNPTTPGDPCNNHGALSINSANGTITFNANPAYIGLCSVKVVFNDQNATLNLTSDVFTVLVGTPGAATLTVTTPILGGTINQANQSAFVVSGTCSEIGFNVEIFFVNTVQNTLCLAGGTYTRTYNLTSLPDSTTGYFLLVSHETADVISFNVPKNSQANDTMTFTLTNPTTVEGFTNTINLRVNGFPLDMSSFVLYGNSACTAIISQSSTLTTLPSEIQADLTIPSLNSCQSYEFRVRYTDSAGNVSPCSSQSQAYRLFGFRRAITLAPTTSVVDQIVEVNLTTLNFNYANIRSNAEDVRFATTSGNLITHHTDDLNLSGNSKFVIKVPAVNTNQVNMYYCQPNVLTTEDYLGTYTYSVARAHYVEMKAVAESVEVSSYINANPITFTAAAVRTLNANDSSVITPASRGPILTNGPITARANSTNARNSIASFKMLGTSFSYPTVAGNMTWTFYNPNAATIVVNVIGFDTGGAQISNTNVNVGANSVVDFVLATANLVSYATSASRFLAFHSVGNNFPTLLAPTATEVFGVISNTLSISTTTNATNISLFFSNGTTQNFTLNRGVRLNVVTGAGTQGSGLAVRVVASNPISAVVQNDGDSNAAYALFPFTLLDKLYLLPSVSQYLAVTCPETTTIEIVDKSNSVLQTQNCTSPGAGFPGKAYFGTGTNIISFPAGIRVRSTKKFFIYFEYLTTDETSVLGPSHARPFTATIPVITLGAEVGI